MNEASDRTEKQRDRVPKRYDATGVLAVIQRLASQMMTAVPITTGYRAVATDRKTRKSRRLRLRRNNGYRFQSPAGTKMARQCRLDSPRGMNGVMR